MVTHAVDFTRQDSSPPPSSIFPRKEYLRPAFHRTPLRSVAALIARWRATPVPARAGPTGSPTPCCDLLVDNYAPSAELGKDAHRARVNR